MYGNGINAYRQAKVVTADPLNLIVMCYDAAISNLKLVQESLGNKEYAQKTAALRKTQDIIDLLLHSLNFEKGGIIAKNLDALYRYMLRRLMEGDLNKDTLIFEEVIGLLEELGSAWHELSNTQSSGLQQLPQSCSNPPTGRKAVAGGGWSV